MQDQIVCPHCHKDIPLTQALSHQMQEKLDKQREEDRQAARKWKEEQLQKMAKESEQKQREVEERARQKVEKEQELKMLDAKNEKEELAKQNKEFQQQLLEMNKTMRQMKMQKEQMDLEYEKKSAEAEEKVRLDEQKKLEEKTRFKDLEREKQLNDLRKVNDDLQRKLEQGSQQMQGEVLELELESILTREFPYDEIKPVAKGVRGADVIQIVKNAHGKECGSIIWELKRTKAWSDQWIMKLKEDQRQVKAELAVIITQVLPAGLKYFGNKDGIWVGNYDSILGLAVALRTNLIDITGLKLSSVGKNEKMELLYNYLAGIEFKQRVEAIIEAFSSMQDDLEKEKRWFTAKWAKQEKNIRKVIDNTLGMHGDLQSIMGKALTEVKGLEMLPAPEENEEDVEERALF